MKFEVTEFLPYLLNRAAEQASGGFQKVYKSKYGMLRTEWRVLFHLGHYGEMTANEICSRGGLHKTKVSRAVTALQRKRFLLRSRLEADRRSEMLALSPTGEAAYHDLAEQAACYQKGLIANLSEEQAFSLISTLKELASFQPENQ